MNLECSNVGLPTISVIIPTLNEERNLRRLLPQLLALSSPPEIIVSDGGSEDLTLEIAEQFGVCITSEGKGRGLQLNAGAKLASNDVLLFLHADSTLPETSYLGFLTTLSEETALNGGAFSFSLQGNKRIWSRIYEFNVMIRCKILNLPYGDQGFFIKRKDWNDGFVFSEFPLMEDVEWWERAGKVLNLKILPYPLITSTRRFENRGFLVNAVRNLWTLTRYKFGVSPEQLVKEYYK